MSEMGLIVKDAHKRYAEKIVLDGFSLRFPDRGTVCLFGPSGCGKTTLLNCIAGLEALDSGEIARDGIRRISYLFQEDRLLPWACALKNVAAVLPGKGRENLRAASRWLRRAGLEGEDQQKLPAQLSGGMRRRVAIARSLAYGGDLFLLDEPFQALDEKAKLREIALFRAQAAKALTVFITHDRKEAGLMADVIYSLEGPPMRIVSEKAAPH